MPTFRSSTTSAPTGGGAASVARPAGLEATDTVVLFVSADHGSALTFTAPGFTQVYAGHSAAGTGGTQIGVLVGSGFTAGGTFTVTPSASAWCHLAATAWTDADPAVIVGTDATSNGHLVIPGLSTTTAGAEVLAVYGQNYGGVASTSPTATLLTPIGTAHGWVYTRGPQATVGPSGDLNVTSTVGGRSAVGVQLAIQPPGGGPTPPTHIVEIYDGTTWQPAVVEVYDGSAWQPANIEIT